MELLDALKLQWDWGADEALLETPQDRRRAPAPSPSPVVPLKTMASPAKRHTHDVLAGSEDATRVAAACTTLEELKKAMETFGGCALKHTATQLVFADGPEDAKLLIIGEAPGGEEDHAGKPFVGPAGQLLDKMLASIGLDRTMVRMTNAIPWRPPGNRSPTETEMGLCLPFLQKHIALIKPAGLVTLGAVASKAVLGTTAQPGIRRLRGKWYDATINGLSYSIPCLPTYHPAYLLRTKAAKKEAWEDLLSLSGWLKTNNFS